MIKHESLLMRTQYPNAGAVNIVLTCILIADLNCIILEPGLWYAVFSFSFFILFYFIKLFGSNTIETISDFSARLFKTGA